MTSLYLTLILNKGKRTGLCEQFHQWFINDDKFWLCQNKLKLRDKTTSAQLAHHFTTKRQAYTVQSDENYLLVCSDINGIVHHTSSSGANGQPVIPGTHSGAFKRKSVLLKMSFGLTCGFFFMTMYLVIHQYQRCSFSTKGKPQQ
jgi:hypothetical protein